MSNKEDNLAHVKCIELLINAVNSLMMDIEPETDEQQRAYNEVEDSVRELQESWLGKLKKVFEAI